MGGLGPPVTWAACPPNPLPGSQSPPRHSRPWSSSGPGVKKAKPVRVGQEPLLREPRQKGQPRVPLRPGKRAFHQVGDTAGGSSCQGARRFWPLIWATHAHSSNPLASRILTALSVHGCFGQGELGELAPGEPRVGRAARACHGFCCVPSPTGGGGVRGEMKERREGKKRERECRRERERC